MKHKVQSLFAILIFTITLYSCNSKHAENLSQTITLEDNWKFKALEDSIWLSTKIPNNIFSDLLKHEKIANPFYGSNEKDLQWVSEKSWIYETQFKIEEEFLENDQIDIVFEGLDTYTDVYLNDSLIMNTDNMFMSFEKEIKALLKKQNTLRIQFHSPIKYNPYNKPSFYDNLPGKERIFTRKAACQFGWDWAPNLPGCGIWQPIYLKAWNTAKITNTFIETSIKENIAEIGIIYEIESSKDTECTLEMAIDKEISTKEKKELKQGKNSLVFNLIIENPKLWWTHNLGKPYLYNLSTKIAVNKTTIDTSNQQFGIREIELIREKDSVGSSFYFTLNGQKIFMNGANYIPQDAFLSEVSNSKYEALLKDVVDGNMNMLRVWGGGIYEKDIFYELCDKYGVLIWQDFMYANAMYNAEDQFIQNIEEEAIYQVKRLRNHPCIALWCGNNEIDEAWHNWGWSSNFTKADSTIVWEDYLSIFHKLLPEVVQKYSNTPYSTSSPIFGRGNKRSLYEGDAHYWGVWHDGYDFSMFEKNTGRFMSEYGFQSFPAIKTLQSVIPEEEMSIESPTMNNHQKHPRGNKLIKQYMEDYYHIPEDFENFVYVSQLLQAEGIRQGIEAHRKAKPYCMGTLYWQLNDCWPVVSWSAIDYYGRKKALYYYSKESYKNIIISHTLKNSKLNLYIINDSLESIEANIELRLLDFKGKELWEESMDYKIKANTSEIFFTKNTSDFGSTFDSTQNILQIKVKANHKEVENKLVYFCKPKNMKLQNPEIEYKLEKTTSGYNVVLTSKYLAKNVYLNLPEEIELSDNFFDLPANTQKTIQIETKKNIKDIEFMYLK